MLGSWSKSATQSTMMTQLRALDWDTTGPLQNAPAVIIYHPENGNAFANVGWTGWIATISGEEH
jgi:exportin-7